jgi:hypothetical protein
MIFPPRWPKDLLIGSKRAPGGRAIPSDGGLAIFVAALEMERATRPSRE